MKINDEVKITGGIFVGETAYYLDEIGGSVPRVSNVQLKDTMKEVKVYTKDLEVVNQEEVNDYFKRINLEWKTLNIHPNDSKETEQVHISTAKDGFTLKGREQIEEFIRAVAISGDLIREDEDLVVKHRVKFEVPEDGLYSLDLVHISRPVVVKDGKCLGAEGNYNLTDITKWVEVKVELGEGMLVPFDMDKLI